MNPKTACHQASPPLFLALITKEEILSTRKAVEGVC